MIHRDYHRLPGIPVDNSFHPDLLPYYHCIFPLLFGRQYFKLAIEFSPKECCNLLEYMFICYNGHLPHDIGGKDGLEIKKDVLFGVNSIAIL